MIKYIYYTTIASILLMLSTGCSNTPKVPVKVYSNAYEITDSIIKAEKKNTYKAERLQKLIFKPYTAEFTVGNIYTRKEDSLIIDFGGPNNPYPSTLSIGTGGRLIKTWLNDADSNGFPELIALIRDTVKIQNYRLIIHEYQEGFPKRQDLPSLNNDAINLYQSIEMIDSTGVKLSCINKNKKSVMRIYDLTNERWRDEKIRRGFQK
jgi:hypothetical protein